MMYVGISDIKESSRACKYLVEDRYGREYTSVVYVTDRDNSPEMLDGIPVINYQQFASMYRRGAMKKIIIPREGFVGQSMLLSKLKKLLINMEDVLFMGNAEAKGEVYLTKIDSAKYLPYLEIHVADHCNLNCKGCEHYSGLVMNPVFHNAIGIERDLKQLHKYIDDIFRIRILGGEPLLNPEINDIVTIVRKTYPMAEINIVTNALLIKSMEDDFFDVCKKNNASLYISYYPPLIGKMDEIKRFLEKKGVDYTITQLMTSFRIKYTNIRQMNIEEIFLNCHQAHCYNLYNGRMAACFLPFTTKYYNEYFGCTLPEDGSIDIYDPLLTTEKLKIKLQEPFERCAYCKMECTEVKWDVINSPSCDEDWLFESQPHTS